MKITVKSVDNPLVVGLFVVFITVIGLMSVVFLPVELFPEVQSPYVFVTVQYRGASPTEIEVQINNKIEEELKSINDVKDITSLSVQDFGSIIIQFESGVDNTEKEREVRDAVDNIVPELPSDIETPVVRSGDFARIPIMNVLLYGEGYDYVELKDVAEEVEDVFEEYVRGISNIQIFGGLDREISVFVDPLKLWKKQVSLLSLVNFFSGGGVDTPGGKIGIGSRDYPVRVLGKFKDAQEVEKIIFSYVNGKPIYLKDLGSIVDGTAEITSFARYNGKPAVSLAIIKQSDTNMLAISNAVYEVIERIEKSNKFPKGLELVVVGDQASEVRTRLDELAASALQGIIVVFIVLFFGIGFKNAIIATLAIPFCFLLTLIGLLIFDDSINNIVQFGLVIIIGIVVDGAIVVMENIYRHREMGKDRIRASKEGTEEVGTAVVSSALTTIAAFTPMLFMSGLVGEFMGYIPKTVIMALVGSIIFDHIVIPVICSRYIDKMEGGNWIVRFVKKQLRKVSNKYSMEGFKAFVESPFSVLFRKYSKFIEWSISNRLKVAIVSIICFIGGVLVMSSLEKRFFPEIDLGKMFVTIELPLGSNVESTNEVVLKVEKVVKKYMVEEAVDEDKQIILFYSTNVGSSGVQVFAGDLAGSKAQGPNIGRIDIDMLPSEERTIDIDSFISVLRKELVSSITGARIGVHKPAGGPPTAAPINVVITGNNIQVLKKLSQRAQKIVKQIPGAIDIRDDYGLGRGEIQIDIDRIKAQRYGISTNTIQTLLFILNNGYELASYQYGTKDLEIRLRIDEKYKNKIEDLAKITVFSEKLRKPIMLTQIASINIGGGLSYIRHENLRRAIVVSGEVDVSERPTTEVASDVIRILSNEKIFSLPEGYNVRFRGENEDRDQSFEDLGYAFIAGFMLIYFIIVIQLNSFLQPFAIMVTVMLSVVGVSIGLLLSGSALGIMVLFGFVSLIGIVVNDAIVLVSYINLLRKRGEGIREAILNAGKTRLRPILLTTFTTIGGLLPLALAVGGTRSFWSPMGWTIISGLFLATLQTLIVVPVAYSVIEDLKGKLTFFIKGLKEKYTSKYEKKYLD